MYPRYITPVKLASISLEVSAGNPFLREVGPRIYVSGIQAYPPQQPTYALLVSVGTYEQSQAVACRNFLRASVPDMTPLQPDWVNQILDRAMAAEGPVLFSCDVGLSRSASLAYGMLRLLGREHDAALAAVRVDGSPFYPSPITLQSVRNAVEAM